MKLFFNLPQNKIAVVQESICKFIMMFKYFLIAFTLFGGYTLAAILLRLEGIFKWIILPVVILHFMTFRLLTHITHNFSDEQKEWYHFMVDCVFLDHQEVDNSLKEKNVEKQLINYILSQLLAIKFNFKIPTKYKNVVESSANYFSSNTSGKYSFSANGRGIFLVEKSVFGDPKSHLSNKYVKVFETKHKKDGTIENSFQNFWKKPFKPLDSSSAP